MDAALMIDAKELLRVCKDEMSRQVLGHSECPCSIEVLPQKTSLFISLCNLIHTTVLPGMYILSSRITFHIKSNPITAHFA